MTDPRPSPEALLETARRESRGRLKILLGAAPGVGKTVEMLREGADLLRAGTDVVVGVVETHGRKDTGALVEPFEVLPLRQVAHGGQVLGEFDIDAMLARRPGLALVDELAHSNAPGSRHPKRWQDIEELRDAGIDVITTLNIQHVESLNDVVASFTHVRVRETVPDACLEDAEVEVVDIPPDELIARLKAGKVYIPEEATRALANFFSRSNLSALRELALRRAALAIDRQMLDQQLAAGHPGGYASGERLVVAIGDAGGADSLVREAKQLADGLRSAWFAVSIETPRSAALGPGERQRVADALDLAGRLGASIAAVPAVDVVTGLADYLGHVRATTLVIGKVRRSRWFELRHRSVVDQLVRRLERTRIMVIPASGEAAPAARAPLRPRWPDIAIGAAAIGATTLLALLLQPWLGPGSVDLFYLLPVVVVATVCGLRAAVITALAAALAYNFFFLPPIHRLTIEDPANVVTFAALTGVGVLTAQLAGRMRRQAQVGARMAQENADIAAFGQRLAALSGEADTANTVADEVARLLGVACVVLRQSGGRIETVAAQPARADLGPLEIAAAAWAFERAQRAGRATATLTASDWQFHPLETGRGVLAVIGVSGGGTGSPIAPDRQTLFATLKGQAALAWERLAPRPGGAGPIDEPPKTHQ